MNTNNQNKKQHKSTVKPALRLLAKNFFEHDVAKNAAALAYYLFFTIFPFLIFLSNLLGLLDLNVTAITEVLQRFVPSDIVNLIETYFEYVSHNSSHALLWFALVFSIWFPTRAAKGLMSGVRQAYHLGKPLRPISYTFRCLIYTVVLLVVIVLTLLLSTVGEYVLSYVNSILKLSDYFLRLWQYLRFVPAGLLMLAALASLYESSLDHTQPIKNILPGVFAALFSWMAVSVGYSFYVENFANYSVIYGTLGTVIVLLMWLYLTSVFLILGAEFNAALLEIRTGTNETKIEKNDSGQTTP